MAWDKSIVSEEEMEAVVGDAGDSLVWAMDAYCLRTL
jgi:hypothetical protein